MKRYFQEAYRDEDSDVVIQQFSEIARLSGLIVVVHISTVEVQSQISTEELIAAMKEKFYYKPAPKMPAYATISESRHLPHLSLQPQPDSSFCDQSALTIVKAFRSLTFNEVTPNIQFSTPQSAEEFQDDDAHILQIVVQKVDNTINEIAPASESERIGQYL